MLEHLAAKAKAGLAVALCAACSAVALALALSALAQGEGDEGGEGSGEGQAPSAVPASGAASLVPGVAGCLLLEWALVEPLVLWVRFVLLPTHVAHEVRRSHLCAAHGSPPAFDPLTLFDLGMRPRPLSHRDGAVAAVSSAAASQWAGSGDMGGGGSVGSSRARVRGGRQGAAPLREEEECNARQCVVVSVRGFLQASNLDQSKAAQEGILAAAAAGAAGANAGATGASGVTALWSYLRPLFCACLPRFCGHAASPSAASLTAAYASMGPAGAARAAGFTCERGSLQHVLSTLEAASGGGRGGDGLGGSGGGFFGAQSGGRGAAQRLAMADVEALNASDLATKRNRARFRGVTKGGSRGAR